MSTKTTNARERILETAEAIILQNGYSSTSIDDILQQANITKGGFFYHFNGKKELARALVERYLQKDNEIFDDLLQQADAQSDDPLKRMLIFLDLFAEMVENLDATHPGCLVAGFTYESQQLDDEVKELIKQGVLIWRKIFLIRFEKVAESYPINTNIELMDLADMFTSAVEGGIILSRIFGSNHALVKQVRLYQDYVRMVFANPLVHE